MRKKFKKEALEFEDDAAAPAVELGVVVVPAACAVVGWCCRF